jgi:hypothetical protein
MMHAPADLWQCMHQFHLRPAGGVRWVCAGCRQHVDPSMPAPAHTTEVHDCALLGQPHRQRGQPCSCLEWSQAGDGRTANPDNLKMTPVNTPQAPSPQLRTDPLWTSSSRFQFQAGPNIRGPTSLHSQSHSQDAQPWGPSRRPSSIKPPLCGPARSHHCRAVVAALRYW